MSLTDQKKPATLINYGLLASVSLIALAAPISIAATQTAWVLALLFWVASLFYRRPTLSIDLLRGPILFFVGWTLLSSALSFEPEISIRKMVSVVLVSIVFLVTATATTEKRRQTIIALLLVAATASALFAIAVFIVGKHLKINTLDENSPLLAAGVRDGDTIVSANGQRISSPDDLRSITFGGSATIRVYRVEVFFNYELPKIESKGDDSSVALGITSWSRGRDMRAAGFYGHYTTFAETLQLTLSLAIGILLVAFSSFSTKIRIALGVASAMMAVALFLSVTRASWAGAAAAFAAMIFVVGSRRTIVLFILLSIPAGILGFAYLQHKRNVSFVDGNDGSTTWRLTVWSEGAARTIAGPREALIGVGMDSLKKRWQEWQMFDNGNLPIGHLHSTPLQLAFERGYPTLIAWLLWMFVYLRQLLGAIRDRERSAIARGILLGSFGGTVGFLLSGIVHYNWGDSEVVMVFYLIMGVSLSMIYANQTTETAVTN